LLIGYGGEGLEKNMYIVVPAEILGINLPLLLGVVFLVLAEHKVSNKWVQRASRLRLGLCNIRSLSGKSIERVKILRERKISIACV